MLLALWPLFISTTPLPPQQDISGLVAQHIEQKYEKAIAKHVTLHVSTSQKQEINGFISAKYAPEAAQHNVFLFANTGQQQEVTGSVVTSNRTFADTLKPKYASTHYRLNVATAQSQSISCVISAKYSELESAISATLSDEPIQVADKHIGLYAASIQNHHIVGKITLSEFVPINDADVSTHSLASVSTAQAQEISCKIAVTNYVAAPISVSVKAATYQRQAISGKITTNDDTEMLMVLMALLEFDDIA